MGVTSTTHPARKMREKALSRMSKKFRIESVVKDIPYLLFIRCEQNTCDFKVKIHEKCTVFYNKKET